MKSAKKKRMFISILIHFYEGISCINYGICIYLHILVANTISMSDDICFMKQ